MLKRYESSELGESASRRVSFDCQADYAKSSRSNCRVCKKSIEQNMLRLALMLQDMEGYKSTAWTHVDCFWKHPETKKLAGTNEVHNFAKLKAEDRAKITAGFEKLHATTTTRKKRKAEVNKTESSDEEFSVSLKATKRRKPISTQDEH